ncbi:collagen-like protein (plasmid) [Borrelia coriaceae]|uniref:Uncharacterized protein n=1 Tax=Borrelia coriaceae ATCC 43381 TaxID=1408429 RepID=W5SWR9_9SPIR|nr:collagen-like protein [Borrelia coriaceae]AHH11148.1 Hypothetical protein BCO_0025500 [Borrelia coriaceae ATCC 43381]UPA16978.1 collagen-like protein [Borrelia coriaceae]
MKKICMVVCILVALGFVGCVGPDGLIGPCGPKGADGKRGLPGHDGRSDIDLLRVNYYHLLRIYDINYKAFSARKADFDRDIPFISIEFGNEFRTEEQRNSVYAGLGYSIEYIEIVKQIIIALKKIVSDANREHARGLLLALKNSSEYFHDVIEIMNSEDMIRSDVNLSRLKRGNNMEDVNELNAMLMELLYKRECVISDIKEILDSTKLFLVDPSIIHHIANIKFKLKAIVSLNGKVYKKIYTGEESLKGLRDAIEKKMLLLKQTLVP